MCQILADSRNLERNRTQKGAHGLFQYKAMVVIEKAETEDKRPEAKRRERLAPKLHRFAPGAGPHRVDGDLCSVSE